MDVIQLPGFVGEAFASSGFHILRERSLDGRSSRWTWHGEYHELAAPAEFLSTMQAAETEATEGVRVMEMDFGGLVSVNSSMIVYIARLLRSLSCRPLLLRVLYDARVPFQAELFPLLAQRFAVEEDALGSRMVVVQNVAEGAEVRS